MKNLFTIAILCIIATGASAQKIIEKHKTLSAGSDVSLNIQIADSITIITWDKNEAYMKATVNVNDNKDNDYYKWTFDSTSSNFDVESRFDYPKGHNGNGCGCDCNCNCNSHTDISVVVYIPANTDVKIETINGDITITGTPGEVNAKTISGFVDMAITPARKADLTMSTISGRMYSNVDLNLADKGTRRVGGTHIDTELNGGGKPIRLETISGDIFFRKAG